MFKDEKTTGDKEKSVPLITKTNGTSAIANLTAAIRKAEAEQAQSESDSSTTGKKDSLSIEKKGLLKRELTVESKKSSRSGKSSNQLDDFDEPPESIIPTKGQTGAKLDRLYEDFDLKYTSGRRYCGVYLPTLGTAFDPSPAEELYQRYVFRERLGSVLTTAIIELIMRIVAFILVLSVSRQWDHASCWILIFTSLMDTGNTLARVLDVIRSVCNF